MLDIKTTINELDRLDKRLVRCRRLLHDDDEISDQELAAVADARELLRSLAVSESATPEWAEKKAREIVGRINPFHLRDNSVRNELASMIAAALLASGRDVGLRNAVDELLNLMEQDGSGEWCFKTFSGDWPAFQKAIKSIVALKSRSEGKE